MVMMIKWLLLGNYSESGVNAIRKLRCSAYSLNHAAFPILNTE